MHGAGCYLIRKRSLGSTLASGVMREHDLHLDP